MSGVEIKKCILPLQTNSKIIGKIKLIQELPTFSYHCVYYPEKYIDKLTKRQIIHVVTVKIYNSAKDI